MGEEVTILSSATISLKVIHWLPIVYILGEVVLCGILSMKSFQSAVYKPYISYLYVWPVLHHTKSIKSSAEGLPCTAPEEVELVATRERACRSILRKYFLRLDSD